MSAPAPQVPIKLVEEAIKYPSESLASTIGIIAFLGITLAGLYEEGILTRKIVLYDESKDELSVAHWSLVPVFVFLGKEPVGVL